MKDQKKGQDEFVTEEEFQMLETFFKERKGEIFFKKKYFQSQKLGLQVDARELYEQTPDMPLKQVILTLMEPLPDFLPKENLIEIPKIIAECWEKLSEKTAA